MNLAPEIVHNDLMQHAARSLAFQSQGDYSAWRQAVEAKLRAIIGDSPDPVPVDVRIEYTREHEEYRETRFIFSSERGVDVPCHLLLPNTGNGSFTTVICLQGHTTGMHISLGRTLYEEDVAFIKGGRDFALQAVREGYAALAVEQRCFGERHEDRGDHNGGCLHATMVALLLGRTMIGERVWDVSRAIDALAAFPEVDTTRIGCMGESGGGTITYYAACLDPRVRIAMPSCAVCSYQHSIGEIDHCADNYLPGALKYFEMGDLAGLIAPRPLIVVAGRLDQIFPLSAVQANFDTIQAIYTAAGVPDQCRLLVGESGHQFYPELAWPVYRELLAQYLPA